MTQNVSGKNMDANYRLLDPIELIKTCMYCETLISYKRFLTIRHFWPVMISKQSKQQNINKYSNIPKKAIT